MSLWHLFIILVAAGVGLYAVNRFIPMDQRIKQILGVVVVLVILFVVLEAFGVIDVLKATTIGKRRH